ncbi:phage tail protein [Grimontia sp. SpTr1]|uniref:phage tail-collar fiber domain-containing protein n=1 Tax=Grimontia sp. SpTr1 TaxID=2995319 RepID=UPI00248B6617|nr:phage tail protein [Grimontia sp. SpTr1]
MSTVLVPTLTEAGLQALFNATQDGLDAKITQVGLGEGAYAPDQTRTVLESEVHRLSIASGKRVGAHQVHLNVIDDTDHAFWVREVGFYLDDGTLLAVYSASEGALAYKSPTIDLVLAFDLSLNGIPADSINVVDTGADLNILFAPELARLATASINTMRRYLVHRLA